MQTKHYVNGRHSFFMARFPTLPRNQVQSRNLGGGGGISVFFLTGRRWGTGARLGAGAGRPGTGDEGAPRACSRALARAHPPHKPRLAAPPPRKTAAAPPVSPHPRARALAASRARFKPAASQLPPAVTAGAARVAPLPNPFCKAGK